jgi:hypothetical protein
MGNIRELTYTERTSVALTYAQHQGLRRFARRQGVGMSVIMREALLAQLGRQDLSLQEETAFPVGKNLYQAVQDRPGHSTRVVVNHTREQRRVFERAALSQGTSVSHLLRSAGLRAAGVAEAKPAAVGRPIGS